jgi:ribosomal protein L11 methyltransferase
LRTSPAIEASLLSDLVLAALLDFDVAAIDEDARRIYFHTEGARDAALAALPSQFPELTFTSVDVPDEDWAARSQASLRAIQVGNIIVAPPWDTSRQKPAPSTIASTTVGAGFSRLIEIIIQPSMGFGTGHHATTRLCLAALQQLDLRGARVLDVGTGSGVLAIAASRLGAATVVAIDDDPDAIESAAENVQLNEGAHVQLQAVDLRSAGPEPGRRASLGQFDAVIGNLTGGLLVQAAGALQALTASGGTLVLSGFMTHEEADVLSAFAGFTVRARATEDEWLCVTFGR